MNQLILPQPFKVRKEIPFFHDKSEAEFRLDRYEYYEEVVSRQLMLHYCDQWYNHYPFESILKWIDKEIKGPEPTTLVDVGCGVGRLIGELANRFQDCECWGIDYSYQLLRKAHELQVLGKSIEIDGRSRGFEKKRLDGNQLKNLNFGLARGEQLPFQSNSIDLIVSTFSLDRFQQPVAALKEFFRTLKANSKCLIVSPLNFLQPQHWDNLHPQDKLLDILQSIGFSLLNGSNNIIVEEPMDKHGNYIHWKCLAFPLIKTA